MPTEAFENVLKAHANQEAVFEAPDKKPQTFSAFEGKVRGNTVVGVSLLQKGPALGHGVWVDNVMLEQAKRSALSKGKLKAKVNHWTGLEDTVGYFERFRIRDGKLLADLQLFESAPQAAQLLEMIDAIPGSFGVSISFAAEEPEYDKDNDKYNARVRELYSADFVDTPAANRDGVFEAPIDNTNEDMANDAIEQVRAEFAAKEAELIAKITDLESKVEGFSRAAGIIEETIVATPAPEPQADPLAKFDAKFAELETLLKTFAAAPPTNQTPAPVNEPEAAPEPPKSYADARKEAIGAATGLARLAAIRKFEEKHPSEAAYIASFKK